MAGLERVLPNVYRFEDTCNVYVVTHEDHAVLIDCGSGAVEPALHDIGVKTVDWVLFTHHHRDQCCGTPRFVSGGTRLAVPRHERFLFERAEDYWQQKRVYDNFNDRNTFLTLGENLPVAETLDDYESFTWEPYSFFVLPTPGHTQGSITLIVEIDETRFAFTGDLMHDGGKLYQLHAMENDYGDLTGANWVAQSICALKKKQVSLVLPSHGPIIRDPAGCMETLDARLHDLMALQRDRLGGTPDGKFAHEIKMEAISPHLLWGTDATCSNFFVIRADNGRSLMIDYPYASAGLFLTSLHTPEPFAELRFIEHHLDELTDDWGITSFDVVVPTHIHDDHVCGIPYLQRHHGTQCWSLDDVAKVLEAPHRWNTPCIMSTPIRIDRQLTDGERFTWEGFDVEIVFYPGQTEFHAAIFAEIDDRRVLFSGDSTYPLNRYLPEKESEWMVNSVLRNSLTYAMHRKCADEFERLRPQLVCPGHGPNWDVPPDAYASHRAYAERKEAVWRSLLPEPGEVGVDLFWARLMPYQTEIARGETAEFSIELRNSFGVGVTFEAELNCPHAASVEPTTRSITLAPGEQGIITFQVCIEPKAPCHRYRRHLVTADLCVNGKPHGPITEALLVIPR